MINKIKVLFILTIFVSTVDSLSVFWSEKTLVNTVEAQNQSARLSLEISNSQETYLQAEPISINLKLSNKTNQPITWRGSLRRVTDISFIVTNNSGVKSRWDGNRFMAPYSGVALKIMQPEAQTKESFLIGGDLFEELFPSPGQYDLQVEFVYDGNREGERRIKILSNSIPIKIVEPQGVNKQAYQYIKEKLGVANTHKLNPRATVQLKQEFVDRFRNSVYAKYIIFTLGTSYETMGEGMKALRELCKIHGENFHHTKEVERIVLEIDARLHPVTWIPNAPIPIIKHPCTGKVLNEPEP